MSIDMLNKTHDIVHIRYSILCTYTGIQYDVYYYNIYCKHIHINFTGFIVGHLGISHHIHTWFTGIVGEVQILHKVT